LWLQGKWIQSNRRQWCRLGRLSPTASWELRETRLSTVLLQHRESGNGVRPTASRGQHIISAEVGVPIVVFVVVSLVQQGS